MPESEKPTGLLKKLHLKKKKKLQLPKKEPKANLTEMWDPTDLQPHPMQSEFFRDTSTEEFDDLVDDIHRNGMTDPIEILPDGTIISGHRRTRAARRLRLSKVPVVVRHDLEQKGDAAIEQRMIETNLHRRQFTSLERARLYKRLRDLEPAGSNRRGSGSVRDEIGKRVGISGRMLDRYMRLLDGPQEFQQAVERGLPLKLALELLQLPAAEVSALAKQIADGASVATLRRRGVSLLIRSRKRDDRSSAIHDPKRLLRDVLRNLEKLAIARDATVLELNPNQQTKIRAGIETLTNLLKSASTVPAAPKTRLRKPRLTSKRRPTAA